MRERITVSFPDGLKKTVEEEELDALGWVKQAIKLGLLVEKGVIFRKLGDDYHVLRMKDINPYPAPSGIKPGERAEVIKIPRELATAIEEVSQLEVRDWINRALTLRLMAKNLNLLAHKDDEFVQVSFEE